MVCMSLDILLVEDNPADIRLAQEALKDNDLDQRLSVVRSGIEALAFLRRAGKYHSAPKPCIILLDLNLPLKDGRAVLNEVNQDKELQHIPIIVFTTSEREEDIVACYQAGANCYISKPADFHQFMDIIKLIELFWLRVAKLP